MKGEEGGGWLAGCSVPPGSDKHSLRFSSACCRDVAKCSPASAITTHHNPTRHTPRIREPVARQQTISCSNRALIRTMLGTIMPR